MEDRDVMREMAIQRGYVPEGCELPGMLVMGLTNQGQDPCIGCNCDRDKCGVKK